MSSKSTETREDLANDITSKQIKQLIDERKATGATSCKVVTVKGQRILVCQYPPL